MENSKYYINILKNSINNFKEVECKNCTYKTLICGNFGFCNVCELGFDIEQNFLPEKSALEEISTFIGKGMIAEAVLSLDKLSKVATTPKLAYVLGVFYSLISDYKYNDLNYARAGFMEENSSNIYYSLDMVSKAKEQFYKTLTLISKSENLGSDILYLNFITNVRLKRSFYMLSSLKALNQNKTGEVYNNYANMVYAVLSKHKDTEKFIKPLINNELNTFYYASKHLYQNKKIDDSFFLLTELNSIARIPMAFYFSKKVENIRSAIEI
ncbi:MAG: hypothetical protein ACP5M9_03270 [Candidatus Micrarchaeia archaeon]